MFRATNLPSAQAILPAFNLPFACLNYISSFSLHPRLSPHSLSDHSDDMSDRKFDEACRTLEKTKNFVIPVRWQETQRTDSHESRQSHEVYATHDFGPMTLHQDGTDVPGERNS